MKGLLLLSILILGLVGTSQPALVSVLRLHKVELPTYKPRPAEIARWLNSYHDQVWESECTENCDGPKLVTDEMVQNYETKLYHVLFSRRVSPLHREHRLLGLM